MECRKWEELGLLYSAQELDPAEKSGYEKHLEVCAECREELRSYGAEHERFFTPAILGDSPRAEVDAEILLVCSDPRPKVASVLFPSAFFRKAFVPALLFIIGFISVGYIMMNMENARQTGGKTTAAVQQQTTTAQTVAVQAVADSVKDSLGSNPDVNFARTRGNLNDKGVITVDLKK